MKTKSDEEAALILRKIREGVDTNRLLRLIEEGDLLLQMAVLPETRFRYKLPYRSEMPEEYVSNNTYLDSLIYEASSLYSAGSFPSRWRKTASRVANLNDEEYLNLYLKPFHAAEVIDPRLSGVKISSWTSVCDDDELMRDLLSVWLRCEYHFTAAFQKDLFFEDMANQGEDFCSSLLVNITLGYACVWLPNPSHILHI